MSTYVTVIFESEFSIHGKCQDDKANDKTPIFIYNKSSILYFTLKEPWTWVSGAQFEDQGISVPASSV
jgi:hypothetical protein